MNCLTKSLSLAALSVALGAELEGADRSKRAPAVVKVFRAPEAQVARHLAADPRRLLPTIDRLKSLHAPLGKPERGDWLDQHKEAGQTYREYVQARAVTPTERRSVIYVQPLGEFTAEQRRIVELSAEFLSLYMNRTVKILDDLPNSIIPDSARRTHPQWNVPQILTSYVLKGVLQPRLPDDAAAYIAFTAIDLWPGGNWNYVFGQASLRDRVGVWSMHRNGDPSQGGDAYRVCLRRTLKTATHETGHMFSMPHCTAYECNMCGANHLEESDGQPLYLCPECHAKACWATGAAPVARYQKLAEFCQQHKLTAEQTYFEQAAKTLGKYVDF